MNDEKTVEQMRRFEHAWRQEDSWKGVREDADRKLREAVNRKYLGAVKRKVVALCKKNTHGDYDRHWWLSEARVYPNVDHSKSPWSVSALVVS